MKPKILIMIASVILIVLNLTACGSTQSTEPNHSQHAEETKPAETDHSQHVAESTPAASDGNQVSKAIEDELSGLTNLEKEVNNGDFKAASAVFEGMHDQFHTILAILKDKKGNTYVDKIHPKFDALEDAINKNDKDNALNLIKINRDALHTTAKDLGVTLNQ